MVIFFTLLTKLLPLYAIVLLGYIAGKYLQVQKESIAPILIYIIAPVIIFYGVVTTDLDRALISLPFLFLVLTCSICLIFYFIGSYFYEGSEKNILAFTSGVGNTGYFGLPVVLALLGDKFLGIAVLSIFGFILYENSLGFFITARGQHSSREAFLKVVKLPTLYAFVFGLIINFYNITLSPIILDAILSFRGAYVVLGMMLIGLGLSQVTKASLDYVFTGVAFFAKFIVWPCIVGFIVFLDIRYFNFYSSSIHKVMLLMSIVPLASNTVAYATKFNTHPEKVALTVLLSTIFALIYIPIFIALVFPLI